MSSIAAMVYAVRDDRDRRLHAVRSVGAVRYCSVLSWHLFWKTKTIELAVCNFHRKAPNVCLFNFCWSILWSDFWQKIIYLHAGFGQSFIIIITNSFTHHFFFFFWFTTAHPFHNSSSLFHFCLKTYLFHKYYLRSFTSSFRIAFTDYCPESFFWATQFLFFVLVFPYFFVFIPCEGRISSLCPPRGYATVIRALV